VVVVVEEEAWEEVLVEEVVWEEEAERRR